MKRKKLSQHTFSPDRDEEPNDDDNQIDFSALCKFPGSFFIK